MPDAEFIDVSSSVTARWESIVQLWAGVEDLVLIEQDIEIHAQVPAQFASCQSGWCAFGFPLEPGGTPLWLGTGCTRISAAAQRLVPTDYIYGLPNGRDVPGHWNGLDGPISAGLAHHGLEVCRHTPYVRHRGWEVGNPDAGEDITEPRIVQVHG